MTEANLMRSIQLTLGKITNLRIFRNNVGTGWVGKSIRNKNNVIVENARPLHAGLCEGSSDLIGWTTLTVTPEMVGKKIAIFTALEIKNEKGYPTKNQLNFINVVNNMGGIGAIVRNENEAKQAIKTYETRINRPDFDS